MVYAQFFKRNKLLQKLTRHLVKTMFDIVFLMSDIF